MSVRDVVSIQPSLIFIAKYCNISYLHKVECFEKHDLLRDFTNINFAQYIKNNKWYI